MLISPPFLPLKQANETDEQWIGRAMSGGEPGDGAYPVSFNLGWHGGLHLTAPVANAGFESVRAIADGTVVYKRGAAQAAPPPSGDAPLNYRNARTSNNVVVIRHETEIGAARQGDAPTRVVFFSIYMHLHTVRDTVRQGQRIYRKDEIGQAGYIYGGPNRIHFEIICDDENLQALIHRVTGDVPLTVDGRDDAVFGELYFHLHATTLVHAQRPALNVATPPGGVAVGEEVFVGLRYAEGEGPTGQRGHLHVTSYRTDGSELGDALTGADAEYNLYKDANAISTAHPATGRPAPSAAYELLRFGRVLGPDALNVGTVPHWREIRTPTGTGWVNLNAADVHKFSDADFPQWRGWTVIDDSADRDSRCDSAVLRGWLQGTTPTPLTPQQAEARLHDDAIRAKLTKVICKFPTEWEAASIEQRWGWLRANSDDNPEPLDEASFERLRAHLDALAFWAPASVGIPPNHWHFQPRAFISHFRKCGWLSENEMIQLFPATALRKAGAGWVSEEVTPDRARLRNNRIELNRSTRKYVITSPQRIAAFYGNTMQETMWFAAMIEGGEATKHYHPWGGRGFMQLTWPNNYIKYWRFRGRAVSDTLLARLNSAAQTANTPPKSNAPLVALEANLPSEMPGWRNAVRAENHDAADSAGAYWAWSNAAQSADMVSAFMRDTRGSFVYYTHQGFGQVAATVNVGQPSVNYGRIYGVQARFQAYTNSIMILFDLTQFPNAAGQLHERPDGWEARRS